MTGRLGRCVEAWRHALTRGVFPYEFAWVLELPWRRLVLSPTALASRLPLRAGAWVLELGAGSGYHSTAVGARLSLGHLVLLDLQTEMLARTRVRTAAARTPLDGSVAADAAALPIRDQSLDLVYLVTVFGEIRSQRTAVEEIRRVVRPGGVLSVSEHLPDPDFVSLPRLRRLVEPVGFTMRQHFGARFAYTVNFERL